ncbi:MAG: cyclic nucleotide-binding domain-containing protein, partial [Pseudobdellovibrio sp.]
AIPRVFGSIFHVLNHKGLRDGTKAKIDWMTLKNYSQRIFGESPKRVEQATQILVKLKQGEYVLGRDPNNVDENAPETEIQGFEAYDLPAMEAFFEFYQYYYFKGGKSELLKYDEPNYNTLKLLIAAYADVTPDKFGIVSKEFNGVVDYFKEYGISLAAGHFTSLEAKGLFCKRKTVDGKVLLQFDIKEFKVQIDIWSLIREIDKLNEKGIVDMTDIDEGPKKKLTAVSADNGIECASCKTIVAAESKFCSECGAKVVAQHKHAGGATERKAA